MIFKKIYTLTMLLVATLYAAGADAQTLIDRANEAYRNGDYAQAAELYEQSGEQDGTSAAYFYNLGNAYYKSGVYPRAILNYERSLLLDPGNEDARFNLTMAQARISDKIEPLGTFFLHKWMLAVQQLFTSNAWAVIAVVAFLLFLVGLLLYVFVERVVWRKIGFFAGLLALLITVGANHFASEQKELLTHRNTAIVMAPTITVKSSPSESGTDLFVLHEGTKVYLTDRVGEWSEIRLEDGNQGWMPTEKLEVI